MTGKSIPMAPADVLCPNCGANVVLLPFPFTYWCIHCDHEWDVPNAKEARP